MNVPGLGEVELSTLIAGKYQEFGGEGILGLPTAQPKKVADGTIQTFANGVIYSSPATGTHLVRGEILKMYLANGGPTGPLGFPMSDEFEVCRGGPTVAHGGWGTDFEHGYIWWINTGDPGGTFEGSVTWKGVPSPGCECGR